MPKNVTRREKIITDWQLHHSRLVTRCLLKPDSSKLPNHQRNSLRRTWALTKLSAPPVPTPSPSDYPPNSEQSIQFSTFPNSNRQCRTCFPIRPNPHPH